MLNMCFYMAEKRKTIENSNGMITGGDGLTRALSWGNQLEIENVPWKLGYNSYTSGNIPAC